VAYKIGALLLAAGMSKRAGLINKLLVPINGTPMAVTALDQLRKSLCRPIFIVTGHEAKRVEQILMCTGVRFVHNPNYSSGLASSLRCGVEAMASGLDAILITLADMPHIESSTCDALIKNYAPEKGHHICVPLQKGKRGNPVLIGHKYFSQFQQLWGDKGGKQIIDKNTNSVLEVLVDDPGVHQDYDFI
jgi:molybdenum cofactor cytidylyltransferase